MHGLLACTARCPARLTRCPARPHLCADVNSHPAQLGALVRPLLPLLRPGGAVILTCKFFGRALGRDDEWRRVLAEALGPDFERVQLIWCLANTSHEQTCVAWRRKDAVAAALPGGGA